jgi:hypothetical protein
MADDGPYRVERDERYYGDRTAAIYRVHWSSRVKFESEDIHEAKAVCAALNRCEAQRAALRAVEEGRDG